MNSFRFHGRAGLQLCLSSGASCHSLPDGRSDRPRRPAGDPVGAGTACQRHVDLLAGDFLCRVDPINAADPAVDIHLLRFTERRHQARSDDGCGARTNAQLLGIYERSLPEWDPGYSPRPNGGREEFSGSGGARSSVWWCFRRLFELSFPLWEII